MGGRAASHETPAPSLRWGPDWAPVLLLSRADENFVQAWAGHDALDDTHPDPALGQARHVGWHLFGMRAQRRGGRRAG